MSLNKGICYEFSIFIIYYRYDEPVGKNDGTVAGVRLVQILNEYNSYELTITYSKNCLSERSFNV